MMRCNLDLDCPIGPKDNLCCIYCNRRNDCPEACKERNKSCMDIDKDQVYCKRTGETVTQDITTITERQAKILLR